MKYLQIIKIDNFSLSMYFRWWLASLVKPNWWGIKPSTVVRKSQLIIPEQGESIGDAWKLAEQIVLDNQKEFPNSRFEIQECDDYE